MYYFYTSTGKLDFKYTGPFPELQSSLPYIESEAAYNLDTSYVLDAQIVSRPVQTTSINKTSINANGNDQLVIYGAPLGAEITITNLTTKAVVTGISDGTDSFVTDDSSDYLLQVKLWPYIDYEVTFNAA